MNRAKKAPKYTEPFLMVVLVVNGILFCLGALSDHSSIVIVIYVLSAALNFFGSWKVGSRWTRNQKAAETEDSEESFDSNR